MRSSAHFFFSPASEEEGIVADVSSSLFEQLRAISETLLDGTRPRGRTGASEKTLYVFLPTPPSIKTTRNAPADSDLFFSPLCQVLHVHPTSVLFTRQPSTGWVIYHEVLQTTKTFIRDLTVIERDWLTELACVPSRLSSFLL